MSKSKASAHAAKIASRMAVLAMRQPASLIQNPKPQI